jgi:hypothetical protein
MGKVYSQKLYRCRSKKDRQKDFMLLNMQIIYEGCCLLPLDLLFVAGHCHFKILPHFG